MKEPITGRDLFVISVLCTGFGFLLAWGLFYRWGSAPTSETANYADWFQAIGSIFSVLIAAAVPTALFMHERRRERRRELAKAKCVFAACTEGLIGQITQLFETWCALGGQQRSTTILDNASACTRQLKEIREALSVGHEFPEIADELVRFVLAMDATHSAVEMTRANALDRWLVGEDPFESAHKAGAAIEAGLKLYATVENVLAT